MQMSRFWITSLVGLCAMAGLLAQDTKVKSATPAKPAATNTQTLITADSMEYQQRVRLAIYTGNVKVDDPEMDILCDYMRVQFGLVTNRIAASTNAVSTNRVASASTNTARPMFGVGGRIQTIYAENNVVIFNKKDKTRAVGRRAVYSATNEQIELTGNPVLYSEQGEVRGDIIIFDRAENKLFVKKAQVEINRDPPPKNDPKKLPKKTPDANNPAPKPSNGSPKK
ncbi:MAG: hypothetical protein EXS24_06760 [Pedosphaera sp.]|nr:hypothetical protein [Pedosphaera sp.]